MVGAAGMTGGFNLGQAVAAESTDSNTTVIKINKYRTGGVNSGGIEEEMG